MYRVRTTASTGRRDTHRISKHLNKGLNVTISNTFLICTVSSGGPVFRNAEIKLMESALDSPPSLNKSLSVLKQLCNNSQLVELWKVGMLKLQAIHLCKRYTMSHESVDTRVKGHFLWCYFQMHCDLILRFSRRRIQSTVFWYVTPCSLLGQFRCLWETYRVQAPARRYISGDGNGIVNSTKHAKWQRRVNFLSALYHQLDLDDQFFRSNFGNRQLPKHSSIFHSLNQKMAITMWYK